MLANPTRRADTQRALESCSSKIRLFAWSSLTRAKDMVSSPADGAAGGNSSTVAVGRPLQVGLDAHAWRPRKARLSNHTCVPQRTRKRTNFATVLPSPKTRHAGCSRTPTADCVWTMRCAFFRFCAFRSAHHARRKRACAKARPKPRRIPRQLKFQMKWHLTPTFIRSLRVDGQAESQLPLPHDATSSHGA